MPGPLLQKLLRHARRLLDRGGAPAPDAALLERFARLRDADAFAELMARHAPAVWGVCRRVLGKEQDAEDAFQATFLVLARNARRVRRAASVGSWLHGVAYRVACKARCRAARRAEVPAATGEPAAATPEPSAELAWRELRALLDEELARLPEVLRAPLLLCYFEGCTQDEAARRLGWKKRTLKARVDRGRRALRARLSRRGVELPAALAVPLLGSAVAAVPPRLTAGLAAAAVRISQGYPPAAISEAALALAGGATAAMTAKKRAIVLAAACAAALVGVGAGRVLSQPEPAKPSAPPAASKTDEPVDAPRVDLHGDPRGRRGAGAAGAPGRRALSELRSPLAHFTNTARGELGFRPGRDRQAGRNVGTSPGWEPLSSEGTSAGSPHSRRRYWWKA
ncbi:MAG TPA: RNA polymerase sigma factor [Gemmataceae bacterium]